LKDVQEAREMIKAIDLDPGLARELYLFAFKGKIHQVEAGKHKVIKETEVQGILKEVPETKLYYICTNEIMCPLPSIFSGKDATAVMLKNDAEVVEHIKRLTGVTIKKSDL
jgi:flavoprotein